MRRMIMTVAAVVTGLCYMARADIIAAFRITVDKGGYEGLSSVADLSGLNYSHGSGISVWSYYSGPYIAQFSTNSDMSTALSAGSWLQFAFDTADKRVGFDKLFMNNDYVVFNNTFKMGVAYDNGSGSFSESVTGIAPADINSGIDLSGFSQGLAGSTLRFRVVFYDDTREYPGSALFPVNSTLSGVENSAAVFSGTMVAIPEPFTLTLAGLGGLSLFLFRRRQYRS